jgi:hypothetical protein
VFWPLFAGGYQNSYHDLYNTPTDVFELPYANGVATLMPGPLTFEQLITQGKVPLALLNSTTPVTGNAGLDAQLAVPSTGPLVPLVPFGFGTDHLLNNTFRLNYALDVVASPDGALTTAQLAAAPALAFRKDLNTNDMRKGNWFPSAPTLMCGGAKDYEVLFFDTQIMEAFWAQIAATLPAPGVPPGFITGLDLEAPIGANDPFAAVKAGFAQLVAADKAAAVAKGATDGGALAALLDYHGKLVPPLCMLATRGYFKQLTGF